MIKKIAVVGVMTLALLAACSKSPADKSSEAGSASTAPAASAPKMDRGVKAAGMLTLIDTAPQCQAFRDQLEEAGKVPVDMPLKVEMADIVAKAHDAGCSAKHGG